jgi:uncharacterized membrane protein YhaH (DUF805 family)
MDASTSPSAAPRTAWLTAVFGLRQPVGRGPYLVACVALLIFRYTSNALALYAATGALIGPLEALSPLLATHPGAETSAPLVAGLLALPSLWVGMALSCRRAADAGLRPLVGLLFLVPVVGYLAMVLLCVLPSRAGDRAADDGVDPRGRRLLHSAAGGAGVGLAMILFSVMLLHDYGAALFVGVPFLIGAVTGYAFNRGRPAPLWATAGAAQLGLALVGAALIAFALEGLICVLMAYPLAAPLAALGALLGAAIAGQAAARAAHLACMLLAWPLLTGAEAARRSVPLREVMSVVEVDAPPAAVWPQVVAFSDLAPPAEWVFRLGIAYPRRARIDGRGVGAVRHCEFSTGAFIEPITAWQEPTRLAFDVASSPPPMHEWSPYATVHAPHLLDGLRSRRGEFRLLPLAGGRTRLEGRTWYELDMAPQPYWTLWSDALIHAIHGRVLAHIKARAEGA